jgi:predicted alpha/beta hydrolase
MYGDVRAATLALSASDDAVAAPGAPKRLLGLYPNAPMTYRLITRASDTRRHLATLACVRQSAGDEIWTMTSSWLL